MELISLEEFIKIPKGDLYGKVFCFPTDTVYGLGAMLNDKAAIKKIFEIKHREEKKPLAILIDEFSNLDKYVIQITQEAKYLMENYWPGPLTLIFEKSDNIIDEVNQSLKTIAFRMPDSKIALKIINHLGYLATTSVNISGEKELNSVDEICKVFPEKIDYIITNQVVLSKCPSTIIDVTTKQPKVIRQGAIKI